MPGPVSVRRASPDDFEAALDLYEAVAAEGRWIGAEAPIDRGERAERWRAEETGGGGAMFVAEAGGALVGLAGVHEVGGRGRTGVMDLGMLVAAEHRGRGIGIGLLEECIRWSREAGAHKVTLQVWPHNEPAIALYEKYGFEREGYLRRHWRRRNGELWDAVVMGLVLDD